MSNAPIRRSTFEFSFPFRPPQRTPMQHSFYTKPKESKFRFEGHPAELVLARSGQENLTPPGVYGRNPPLVGGIPTLVSGTWALPGDDWFRVFYDGDPITDWLPASGSFSGQSYYNHLLTSAALGKTITGAVRRTGAPPVLTENSMTVEPAITYDIVGASAQVHDGSPFVPAMPMGVAAGDLAIVFAIGADGYMPWKVGGDVGWQWVVNGTPTTADGKMARTNWLYLPNPATFGEWNNVGAWACLVLRPSRKPSDWAYSSPGWFGRAQHAQRVAVAETAWPALSPTRAAYSRAIAFYRRVGADEPVVVRGALWPLAEAGADVRVGVAMSPTDFSGWSGDMTHQSLLGSADVLTVELRAYQTDLGD